MKKIILSTLILVAINSSPLASNFVLANQKNVEDHDHGNRDEHSDHAHEKKNNKKKKKKDDHHDHSQHEKHEEHGNHDDHTSHDNLDDTGHEDHGDHEHGDESKKEGDHADHGDHGGHDDHGEEEKGHDSHDHGSSKAIGATKAITEVDEEKGFKLSPEAIKTMDIKLTTVNGESFTINKSTLVTSKNIKGVYRFRGGYFKFLQASSVKEVNNKYKLQVKGVSFGDQIVTNGLGLLRVSDIYSTDKSEYGHSH